MRHPWWLVLGKALFVFVFLVVMTLFTIWYERRVVGSFDRTLLATGEVGAGLQAGSIRTTAPAAEAGPAQ